MLAEGLKVLATSIPRSLWLPSSIFCPLASQISVRSFNSNRAVVTKVSESMALDHFQDSRNQRKCHFITRFT